jgi:hypothetical protein
LQGELSAGYACGKCKAHYSTRFVRQLRRQAFKGLINEHFKERATETTVVREHFVVPTTDQRITELLDEAKQAARRTTQHLEEALAKSRR